MNDLDDELLKELGLEPKPADQVVSAKPEPVQNQVKEPAKPKSQPAAPKSNPKPQPLAESQDTQIREGIASVTQVQIAAVIGKKTTSLKELMTLKEGSLIELNKLPGDTIDLVANGKLVAKGQLVLIDGRVGVQIKQIYT